MISNPAFTVAALAITVSLSGCMATTPSQSVPFAGVAAATVSEKEKQSTPTFADEQLNVRYEDLLTRYREFQQTPDTFLTAAGSISTCNLSETGEWLVTHGKPKQDIQAMVSHTNRALGLTSDTTLQSVALIEGECQNGIPEGPYIGIGEYQTVTTSENTEPFKSATKVRMEGNASDGKMNGTFIHFSDSETTSIFNGQTHVSRSLSASEGFVENGADTGAQLIITSQPQSSVLTTLVRDYKQTAMGRQTEVSTYQGSRLITTVNQINNVAHGWIVNHLMPAGQRKTCMVQGEIADNSACAVMATTAVAIKPVSDDVLETLVREDNRGEYMSPYTSDGVLAEWVNMGTSASIGSTAGSGVGAVAGNMIADKALESVPFGSLIGSVIGSQVGKEMGREAGISAAGGWENIRTTSDRSFDSLTDMARYLAQKYSNEPTYGDAIKVTIQVYPEFQSAMASAF